MMDGNQLKEQGMARAADKTGNAWVAKAVSFITELAREQTKIHINDVDREKFKRGLPVPKSENAWGTVWQQCLKNGVITWSGEMQAADAPTKHKRLYRVYSSLVYNDR